VAFLHVLRAYRPVSDLAAESLAPGGASSTLTAIAFRAFPPAAYTAYATSLAAAAPELAATARAFYFVFGFLHMRTMAREASAATMRRNAPLMFVLAFVMTVPLLAVASPRPVLEWRSVAACVALTSLASLVGALFLSRYYAFMNCPGDVLVRDLPIDEPRPILVHVPCGMGGVRQVTNALAEALEHHGRKVVRAHSVWDVVKARWRNQASAAILSLETGYLAFLFPRSVYILHGFPVVHVYAPWKGSPSAWRRESRGAAAGSWWR
jgi:hypothetical protein